ncbi:MAG TPA: rhodanese-like domain-containing protein [Longimicrobiaceae bacterium]|nr:rhodanese-like domain-containing protein [Longimicrobiaceae bacterium]
MILERFYDEKLAQASYLIGCPKTGSALVVDANRDVDPYVRAAEARGLEITHVTETHIHADFVSGSRDLAERTGAKLHLSDEGGDAWRYAFAAASGAVLLRHGDVFLVGDVRVDVLHTPGHTPEHLSFLVTDAAAADRPMGVLTGDFVFAGDVGRPDLLEKAAGVAGSMEESARTLFRSLQRLKAQPDYLQIWPGHGAGSACGKGLGAVPQSTIGYERLFNPAFAIEDEDEFVRSVLAGQPEPPKYFARMKRINREGPRPLDGFHRPQRLAAARLAALIDEGGLVIDVRPAAEFAQGHVPGAISIPLNRSFTTWAGWLIPDDRDFHLLLDDGCAHCLDEAVRDLAMIGLDRVAGYFGVEVLEAWKADGRALGTLAQITSGALAAKLAEGSVTVLDVRGAAEWEAGHLPGSRNIPLGYLTDHLEELPRAELIVLQCRSGARSAIGASLLQAAGFRNVVNLAGGYLDWRTSGYPSEPGTE